MDHGANPPLGMIPAPGTTPPNPPASVQLASGALWGLGPLALGSTRRREGGPCLCGLPVQHGSWSWFMVGPKPFRVCTLPTATQGGMGVPYIPL